MNQPTYTTIYSYTHPTEEDIDTPELIDFVENYPHTALTAAQHTRIQQETYTDPSANQPATTTTIYPITLPVEDPKDPDYVKLPDRNTFAIPTPFLHTPIHDTRYWALISRNNTERHIIRISFNEDPEPDVDKTDPDYDPNMLPSRQAAQYLVDNCQQQLPPSEEPDAYDLWAMRLLLSLHKKHWDDGEVESTFPRVEDN